MQSITEFLVKKHITKTNTYFNRAYNNLDDLKDDMLAFFKEHTNYKIQLVKKRSINGYHGAFVWNRLTFPLSEKLTICYKNPDVSSRILNYIEIGTSYNHTDKWLLQYSSGKNVGPITINKNMYDTSTNFKDWLEKLPDVFDDIKSVFKEIK